MYCYTIATNLGCVLREMLLWSNTSKEHQTFILTIADLTNKELPVELEDQLMELHEKFAEIEDLTEEYYQKLATSWHCSPQLYYQVGRTIKLFLDYNYKFIKTLGVLKTYGKEDLVWQTLLEHIEDEQKYMGRLLNNLLHQL